VTGFQHTADPGYFENERRDLVAKLPRPLGRVLDVGCGAGGVGRALRDAGAADLTGVELDPGAGARARSVFGEVHEGTVERVLAEGRLRGPYDTVVLYDVLEHLVDPAEVLRGLRTLCAPGARVHVSVPNARHFSLLGDLALRGTFGYTEWGHRDASHLRWFTRRDAERLLEAEGFGVLRSDPAVLGRGRTVDRLTLGRLTEFLALQWHVLARRDG
jgi:2-polyprenyl-3-methyl-5-hydroxy-6-metoxy-1,4-benzoquinol methylase